MIDIALAKLLKGVGGRDLRHGLRHPVGGDRLAHQGREGGIRGEVEGEVGRAYPTSHRSTWEWVPKATFKLEFEF